MQGGHVMASEQIQTEIAEPSLHCFPQENSLMVERGEHHFLFYFVPVVAVCFIGSWAGSMDSNGK